MRDRVFIDTNILIYSYSNEEEKKEKAVNLIKQNDSIISLQVLNEFVNVLKKKFGQIEKDILKAIEEIESSLIIWDFNIDLIKRAIILSERYLYSYFDCLIIASALDSGCSILYTEDMQHSQLIHNKLRILNPFRV